MKSTANRVFRGLGLLILLVLAFIFMYLIFSATMDRKEARTACEEAYPIYTEVVGIVGLDIGTACFDESGGTVKFLGMLEE